MARPSHRLDLLLVPHDTPIEQGLRCLQEFVALGVCDDAGAPGPNAAGLGVGSFARLRLDRPDGVAFYANRQGGFRVACPGMGTSLVAAFSAAMTAWRAGGARQLTCPACHEVHRLDGLIFQPPAAFGRWAIEIADIEHQPVPGRSWHALQAAVGPHRVVWRR